MTLEIELSEPYERMLEELRQNGQSDPDADLRQLVEDAIHNGYQQSQSGQY
jgi:hypothetical protein